MKLFHRIAGSGVGGRTSELLRGFTWIGPSAIIVRFVGGVATLLAARWLGPERFGFASLSLAVTFWIQIPLFCGLPASLTHFIPQQKDTERRDWATVGVFLTLIAMALTAVLGFAFRLVWASLLGVALPVFENGLVWCAGFSIFTITVALLSAYENFRARALVDIGMACTTFAWVFGCYLTRKLTPGAYVGGLAAGYALAGIVGYRLLHVDWRFPPEWKPIAKRLLTYGLIGAVSGIVSALINSSGRLVANRYLPLNEVGILSAYQGGTVQMALFFIATVSQVFFPIASRTQDKQALLRKMTRTIVVSFPVIVLAFCGILILYFTLLGKHYPWTYQNVILFSLAGFLTWWFGMLGWFLAALGERGLVFYSVVGLLSGAAVWFLCTSLIPVYGLAGVAWAQGCGSLISIVFCYLPVTQRFMRLASN